MVFSSLPFLFLFFTVVLLVSHLMPFRFRNGFLLLANLVFYAYGEPVYVLIMIGSILVNFFAGLLMDKQPTQGRRRAVLVVGIVLNLLALGVFKYAGLFADTLRGIPAFSSLTAVEIALPIGISFYTFQAVSYLIDVYWDDCEASHSFVNFACYISLFPQLIAGPIVRYADIARELEHREHSWENAAVGLRRFLVGLGKKVILADNFALLIRLFRQSGEKSVLFYWMYAVAFTLNIYFDFSGYSDMAIGLGRVLGFHFVENFNYPYLSRSVTEFWRRWHISLGSWFRDYVYIPMGGSRVSRWRWVLNILTVWMLTGLWHGAAWNFVLWGLLFAALLLAEKWIPVLQRLPGVLRHGYVLLAVVLSFVLFNADSLAQAGQDFAGLFGFGSLSLTSAETLYYLKSYAVLFVLGILGSTPVVKNAARRIDGTKAGVVLEAAAMLALLIVCTAYLVDGSFSPFLYFRF